MLLWRSRQSRIRGLMSLDREERRALLRSAEAGLRRCLLVDRTDARAYVVLGKMLLQSKRYAAARALYQEGCVATGNTNAYLWSSWGWLEAKVGNTSRARKLYDSASVVDETHACTWHKWGMLEKGQGNYMKARDLWMKGIQLCRKKPTSSVAYLYNGLAVMAAQLGKVDEARAWFEEGTTTAYGEASVALWQAWAVLEANQGDPTAVRYLFKKALQANSRSRYVYLAWAMWERRLGNPDTAVALLKRGQSLNPTDPAIYQAWAIVERERGSIERARRLFEMGLKADPSHIPLWQAWGVMEADYGDTDYARELFQQGVWADPRSKNTVYVFQAWGVMEAKKCQAFAVARELFKAAIKVDPKNVAVWSTWIDMEQELGLYELADELRIRRAEQQWEFEVPAGFTTRPDEAPTPPRRPGPRKRPGAEGQYGDERSLGSRDGGGVGSGSKDGGDGGGGQLQQSVLRRELLPSDFNPDLQLKDIIRSFDVGGSLDMMDYLPDSTASSDDGLEANIRRPSAAGPSRSGTPLMRPEWRGSNLSSQDF
ncbi:MAG: hypothetical protein WDW36_001987 [Sanguina aurantia]